MIIFVIHQTSNFLPFSALQPRPYVLTDFSIINYLLCPRQEADLATDQVSNYSHSQCQSIKI